MQQPTHFSWLVPCVQPEGALDSKAASTASRKQGDKNGKCDARALYPARQNYQIRPAGMQCMLHGHNAAVSNVKWLVITDPSCTGAVLCTCSVRWFTWAVGHKCQKICHFQNTVFSDNPIFLIGSFCSILY